MTEKPDLSKVRLAEPRSSGVRPKAEVQAELDAAFEARRQRLRAELPAHPSAEFLAQVRDDIDSLFENAIDWVALHQSDPRSEKAGVALCRVEGLAYAAYSLLLERTKAE